MKRGVIISQGHRDAAFRVAALRVAALRAAALHAAALRAAAVRRALPHALLALILSMCCLPARGAARIVSLSPHITELLFAAGAGAQVVGVDDASDYPAPARDLPHVGEVSRLQIETLLRLHPTLVVLWQSGSPASTAAELSRLNLTVHVTEQRHLDDIATALLDFGRLAGTQPQALAAADRFRDELEDLRRHTLGRRRLKVFYQVSDEPMYTLSGGHVVSEVLSLCGGENVFADSPVLAPAVNRESVMARDPDVILIGAGAAEAVRQEAAWRRYSNVRAVRNDAVFAVDPSLINRMSPRILEGTRAVCAALERARIANFPEHPQEKLVIR